MIVIDATDMVLGRLATIIAKKALLGETIKLINCEKAVVTGEKKSVLANYQKRMIRGIHSKGPFLPRMADRFVRRTIRGMLPYKVARGAEAYKRIMCYAGIPEEFAKEKITQFNECNISKLPYLKFVTVKDICKFLGAKNDQEE
jgi:large subunit ribosomal protein L13